MPHDRTQQDAVLRHHGCFGTAGAQGDLRCHLERRALATQVRRYARRAVRSNAIDLIQEGTPITACTDEAVLTCELLLLDPKYAFCYPFAFVVAAALAGQEEDARPREEIDPIREWLACFAERLRGDQSSDPTRMGKGSPKRGLALCLAAIALLSSGSQALDLGKQAVNMAWFADPTVWALCVLILARLLERDGKPELAEPMRARFGRKIKPGRGQDGFLLDRRLWGV